jgi:hypothetical protein
MDARSAAVAKVITRASVQGRPAITRHVFHGNEVNRQRNIENTSRKIPDPLSMTTK